MPWSMNVRVLLRLKYIGIFSYLMLDVINNEVGIIKNMFYVVVALKVVKTRL